MSTISAANISDGTTTVGTEYVVQGSTKAWVNYDQAGTFTTRASFNVSSTTDVSEGDAQAYFTSVFADTDYLQQATAGGTGGSDGDESFIAFGGFNLLQVGRSCLLRTRRGSGNYTGKMDAHCVMYSATGDLA